MISLNGVKINSFNFPAGEECVRLSIEQLQPRDKYEFTWKYESSAEFFALQQAVAIIRNTAKGTVRKPYVSLLMPYFPFARQDRATVPNETNALTLFCDTIKTLNLDLISCIDPHSLAVEQHFAPEKFFAMPQLSAVKSCMPHNRWGFEIVVAPDEGALKKAASVAEYYGAYLITAVKQRDPESGKILSYTLRNDAGKVFHRPPRVLVVDDICDGGATFLILGESLRKAVPRSEYTLFTTHGIYSKGRKELEKIYTKVICFNNMEKT